MAFKKKNRRNHLMSRQRLHLSPSNCKVDSNEIIHFIGRQHSFLTEIMDQINFCFSLQVNAFSGRLNAI